MKKVTMSNYYNSSSNSSGNSYESKACNSYLETVSEDSCRTIIQFLHPKDCCSLGSSSKYLFHVVNNDLVWLDYIKNYCVFYWNIHNDISYPQKLDYSVSNCASVLNSNGNYSGANSTLAVYSSHTAVKANSLRNTNSRSSNSSNNSVSFSHSSTNSNYRRNDGTNVTTIGNSVDEMIAEIDNVRLGLHFESYKRMFLLMKLAIFDFIGWHRIMPPYSDKIGGLIYIVRECNSSSNCYSNSSNSSGASTSIADMTSDWILMRQVDETGVILANHYSLRLRYNYEAKSIIAVSENQPNVQYKLTFNNHNYNNEEMIFDTGFNLERIPNSVFGNVFTRNSLIKLRPVPNNIYCYDLQSNNTMTTMTCPRNYMNSNSYNTDIDDIDDDDEEEEEAMDIVRHSTELMNTKQSFPSLSKMKLLENCLGMFVAPYGSHGVEILHLSLHGPNSTKLVDLSGGPNSHVNLGDLQLQGLKITGDPNVPANELSFCINLNTMVDPDVALAEDQRPIVSFLPNGTPMFISLQHRRHEIVLWAKGYGQINKHPPLWNPEWVKCNFVLYNKTEKSPPDSAQFSLLWDDETQFFRHTIDFKALFDGPTPLIPPDESWYVGKEIR